MWVGAPIPFMLYSNYALLIFQFLRNFSHPAFVVSVVQAAAKSTKITAKQISCVANFFVVVLVAETWEFLSFKALQLKLLIMQFFWHISLFRYTRSRIALWFDFSLLPNISTFYLTIIMLSFFFFFFSRESSSTCKYAATNGWRKKKQKNRQITVRRNWFGRFPNWVSNADSGSPVLVWLASVKIKQNSTYRVKQTQGFTWKKQNKTKKKQFAEDQIASDFYIQVFIMFSEQK